MVETKEKFLDFISRKEGMKKYSHIFEAWRRVRREELRGRERRKLGEREYKSVDQLTKEGKNLKEGKKRYNSYNSLHSRIASMNK